MREHLNLPDEEHFTYTGPDWLLLLLDSCGVKGVGSESRWPSAMEFVASVGNGVGKFLGTPNGEGGEIEREREREGRLGIFCYCLP